MDHERLVDEFVAEVIDDFIATSGYSFDLGNSHSEDFAFQVDPVLLLRFIVGPIVEEIVGIIGKRLSERKEKDIPQLTEDEIQGIRELVLRFEDKAGITRYRALTPESASKMADSVEHVVRRNPRALLQYATKE